MVKSTSAEECKLNTSFDQVRKLLITDKYCDRMEQALAYWALPNDRRLPLAILGRSIGELLGTPFDKLALTKGIGVKKMSTMIKLLHRVTKDEPPEVPFGLPGLAVTNNSERSRSNGSNGFEKSSKIIDFDPDFVSEALWSKWRETVKRHNIGREQLGRLAPSLNALPTVIWETPLHFYLDNTLDEIRLLRTHGEKRVHAVLEVFFRINEFLAESSPQEHLSVELEPRFIPPLRAWMTEVVHCDKPPTFKEIKKEVALPLLNQIRIDLGEKVHKLAEGRLGIRSAPQSVRQLSEDSDVSRTRIYQQLEDCGKAMVVRWPDGRSLMDDVAKCLAERETEPAAVQLFDLTRDLCYPQRNGRSEMNRA